VLDDLGISGEGGIPLLEAWNKIDCVDADARVAIEGEAARRDDVAILSALNGEGVAALTALVGAKLTAGQRLHHFEIPGGDGAAIAWLHAHGAVESEERTEDGTNIAVRLSEDDVARFQSRGR
jgi:GTP-binding protein HflX